MHPAAQPVPAPGSAAPHLRGTSSRRRLPSAAHSPTPGSRAGGTSGTSRNARAVRGSGAHRRRRGPRRCRSRDARLDPHDTTRRTPTIRRRPRGAARSRRHRRPLRGIPRSHRPPGLPRRTPAAHTVRPQPVHRAPTASSSLSRTHPFSCLLVARTYLQVMRHPEPGRCCAASLRAGVFNSLGDREFRHLPRKEGDVFVARCSYLGSARCYHPVTCHRSVTAAPELSSHSSPGASRALRRIAAGGSRGLAARCRHGAWDRGVGEPLLPCRLVGGQGLRGGDRRCFASTAVDPTPRPGRNR